MSPYLFILGAEILGNAVRRNTEICRIKSAQIWHNSLIRIENKPILYKSWFTQGMKNVKNLLNKGRNSILSYTTVISKYKIKANFLQYYKVASALKLFRQKCS